MEAFIEVGKNKLEIALHTNLLNKIIIFTDSKMKIVCNTKGK
jgi:hypothetical protein